MQKPTNAHLAQTISAEWCIAGGYAACPALAGDQDVWFFNVPDFELVAAVAKLQNEYPQIYAEPNPRIELMGKSPEGYPMGVLKVGVLDNRHLLVTSASTIEDILKSFDISTHQCAISSDGEFIKGPNWSPIWTPPETLKDTPTTPARVAKMVARYGGLYKGVLA